MDINKQDQRAGENSTQIQAGTINNNYYSITGVSEATARDICRHEYQVAMQNWTEQASMIVEQRVAKLEDKIMPKMIAFDNELKMFADPAFQILLRKAQISAASTDKDADYEMLSDLLLHRIQQDNNRERNLGITKAIEIVDQIDEIALAALSIVHVISMLIPIAPNVDLALQYLNDTYGKLLNGHSLPLGEEWMEHLDILSAIRMNAKGIGAFNKMESFIPKVMDKFFVTGLPSDSQELQTIISDFNKNGIPTNVIIENPLVKGNMMLSTYIYDIDNLLFSANFSGQTVTFKPNENQIRTIKNAIEKFKSLENNDKPASIFWQKWNSYVNLYHVKEWFNQLPLLFNITSIGKALVAAYVAGKMPSLKLPY